MIINLTQHIATESQWKAGVVDLPETQRKLLADVLTFEELPNAGEIRTRAKAVADIAIANGLGGDGKPDPMPETAMIGGALWLMVPLVQELEELGIRAVFAFSKRVATEKVMPDGTVQKVADFRHIGFVPAI